MNKRHGPRVLGRSVLLQWLATTIRNVLVPSQDLRHRPPWPRMRLLDLILVLTPKEHRIGNGLGHPSNPLLSPTTPPLANGLAAQRRRRGRRGRLGRPERRGRSSRASRLRQCRNHTGRNRLHYTSPDSYMGKAVGKVAEVEDVYLGEDGSIQCLVSWKPSLIAMKNLVGEELRRRSEELFNKRYGH